MTKESGNGSGKIAIISLVVAVMSAIGTLLQYFEAQETRKIAEKAHRALLHVRVDQNKDLNKAVLYLENSGPGVAIIHAMTIYYGNKHFILKDHDSDDPNDNIWNSVFRDRFGTERAFNVHAGQVDAGSSIAVSEQFKILESPPQEASFCKEHSSYCKKNEEKIKADVYQFIMHDLSINVCYCDLLGNCNAGTYNNDKLIAKIEEQCPKKIKTKTL